MTRDELRKDPEVAAIMDEEFRAGIRYGRDWGWTHCRSAVLKAATFYFTIGDDAKATMLRDLTNKELVIKEDTFKDAPGGQDRGS